MAKTLPELMSDISANFSQEKLIPDEQGVYSLSCDGLPITIACIKGEQDIDDKVFFYSKIADVPEEGINRILQLLMQLNHHFAGSEGSTFSQNPDDGSFALEHVEPLSALNEENFPDILGTFIRTAQKWSLVIADFDPSDNAFDDTDSPRRPGSPLSLQKEHEIASKVPWDWISV